MLVEGKTKRLLPARRPGTVVFEAKDELTAGDGAKVATIEGIGRHKSAQTANIFRFLAQHNIPTAFVGLEAEGLVCDECEMIPIEFVTRRFAYGSLLMREPEHATQGAPKRFAEPRLELFHKWTLVAAPAVERPLLMPEPEARARHLNVSRWSAGVFTDPLIEPGVDGWYLYPARQRLDRSAWLMCIPPILNEAELLHIQHTLVRPCFAVLEAALLRCQTIPGGVTLADLKIEVGRRRHDGALVIADVIDNDNWRIWPGGDPEAQLDKQAFRDGGANAVVANKYALVTSLTAALLEA
jgi:phosphoribosylaminoimidazole-succinocarboxamide synthase